MILQIHFVCGFVFTLVTGVSWFFASYLNMILQIVFVCGFVFRGITILCELSLLHWFIFISTVCFSLCIVFKCLFCVVSQFKSFFTGSPGVLFTPWIVFMCCLVLLIESYFTGFTCIVLNLYFSRSLNIGYSLTLRLLQSLQVFSN